MPFIGYGTVEQLIEDIPAGETVWVDAVREHYAGASGAGLLDWHVLVTWAEGHKVHYVQVPITRVQTIQGHPVAEDGLMERARLRSDDVLGILGEFLADRGYKVRAAVVAFPRDYQRLDGGAECLHYDRASGRYVRASPARPREAAGAAAAVA